MKKGILFLISLLCILVIFVVTPAFSAVAEGGNYDYAKSGDSAYSTLNTSDILERLLNTSLSDIEREYLSSADLTLNYSTGIPVSNINTALMSGELSVNMKKYSYTANNGTTVNWTPISVNGEAVANNGDYSYSTHIDENYPSDTVDIVYRALFSILKDDINKHINSAYDYSESVYNKLTAEENRYASEYSIYQSALSAYNNYLVEYEKYQKAEFNYQQYLNDYQAWLEKDKAYKDYLVAMETYEQKQKEYQEYLLNVEEYNKNYQKYREYLVKYESYQKDLEQYNLQTSNPEMQTALYQLEVMAYITKPVTDMKRTLSGAILGQSVTTVLSEKEALVTIGRVEERAINLAANATESLRTLINTYRSCKTDAERYAFYILSKDKLSKGFNDLLIALDFLYQYPEYTLVRRTIAKEGKTEQFEILLAQLYYMCNALTEEKLPNYITLFRGENKEGAGYFDSSYKIGENTKRTPLQILGEAGIIEDKYNSMPLENGYPNLPPKPVEPTAVEEPKKPTTVKAPTKPIEVAPAGVEPTAVSEPIKPTEVKEPTAPIQYIPTEKETRYKAAYENKVLQKRTPFSENGVITIDNTITKYFRNAKTVTVRFFDGKSDTPILVLENQEIGSSVAYTKETPTKEKKGYTYTFNGWIDEDGNKIDINRLNTEKADLSLFPSFLETVNLYKVTWEVDNVNFVGSYEYGSIPVYSESEFTPLEKYRSGVRKYRFIGWEANGEFFAKGTDLPIMNDSDRRYNAIFEESYVVTWIVNGLGKSVSVWAGDMPTVISEPSMPADATRIYNFIGWDREVVRATKDATYTAIFETEYYVTCDRWNVSVEKCDGYYQADCKYYGKEFNISTLLREAAKDSSGVKLVLSDAEIFIAANTVRELSQNAVSSIKLNLVILSNSKLRFSVVLAQENGNKYSINNQIELRIKNVAMGDNDYVKSVDGEITEYVEYVSDDNELSLMVDSKSTYSICSIYGINTIATDGMIITTDKNTAEVGEEVVICVEGMPEGKYIKSFYVVTETGDELNVTDMTFTMPNCDVNVGVVLESYTYTIVFRANGKVILRGTYKYGESVNPPLVPDTIAANGNTLKFEGWDKEIMVVTENAEYQAKFTEIVVEQKEPEDTKLTKILKTSYVVIPIVAALVIALIVVLVVVKVRKKKVRHP